MPAFTPFAQSDVVLDTQVVGTSTWTNNTNNLKSMHTASSNAGTGGGAIGIGQVPTPQEQGFTGNDQSGRIAGEAQATAEQQPTMGQLQ